MSQGDIAENTFDVFLCYNREDKDAVKEIGEQLIKKGIKPWLDMWEIPPGKLWQQEIEKQIKRSTAAAVFVGKKGVGPWQQEEIYAFLREALRRKCPVIPVLLEHAPEEPELSPFLEGRRWVDFRVLKEKRKLAPEEEPLDLLIWGIREERPWNNHSHILIASLGDSPIVVSSMYDLLTQEERFKIDQVIVLHPEGKDSDRAYNLVKKALEEKCQVRNKLLPFEDANTWLKACLYWKELYNLLDICQLRGDTVHLSLAGGRKSMAALMAWIVPFFPCIKQLYHVIDPDEEHFFSANRLALYMTAAQREAAMHPNLKSLKLVKIPNEKRQQLDEQFIKRMLAATEEEFEQMQYEQAERIELFQTGDLRPTHPWTDEYERAERIELFQTVAHPGKILEAHVTARVMGQFKAIQQDRDAARHLRDCLERMRDTTELRAFQSDTFYYKPPKAGKRSSPPVDLYSFQSFGTPVRPVFYTLPADIYNAFLDEVERVVICELDMGANGEYRSLQEIAESPGFSTEIAATLETLPVVPPAAQIESVLIVPLGKSPMVATQLYTLLQRQEGRIIREVILLYPGQSAEIANGADLIELALLEEAGVPCRHVAIPGMEDIDDEEKCRRYQEVLEEEIDRVRDKLCEKQLNWKIDLALSGGRKGMTAMTIFAAQNKQLPYVYHTLITDQKLNDKIDDETTVSELTETGLSQEERNDRLFLRAYERERGEKAEPLFTLFKVPVFSADKR